MITLKNETGLPTDTLTRLIAAVEPFTLLKGMDVTITYKLRTTDKPRWHVRGMYYPATHTATINILTSPTHTRTVATWILRITAHELAHASQHAHGERFEWRRYSRHDTRNCEVRANNTTDTFLAFTNTSRLAIELERALQHPTTVTHPLSILDAMKGAPS